MKSIDISILKLEPVKDIKAQLFVEPLAPLSMVSELPGSYYKTLMYPSKKMICGLFENILGWHFDKTTRLHIIKAMKEERKKQKYNVDYDSFIQGSTYVPLLMEYFDLKKEPSIQAFESLCKYDDYWSRLYKRSDSHLHINGLRFMDANIIFSYMKAFESIDADENLKSNKKNQMKTEWFRNHIGKFAQYYSSPTKREFLHLKGSFVWDIDLNFELYKKLSVYSSVSNIGYLGTNEGWVNFNIIKL